MPVLSNRSDTPQRVAVTGQRCCAQPCGQVVQTRRSNCAQPADAIVEIALDKPVRGLLPGKMLYPACVEKVLSRPGDVLAHAELSTLEISRQTFTERFR